MNDDLAAVLREIGQYAANWRAGARERPHAPARSFPETLERFAAPTPQRGAPIADIVKDLIALAEPGLANMVGPRFFGWVIGATEPAGLAADWLASVWAQNTGNCEATPSAAAVEEITRR